MRIRGIWAGVVVEDGRAGGGVVMGRMWLRLVLWRQAIRTNFKCAGLPREAVESIWSRQLIVPEWVVKRRPTYRPRCVLSAPHEDRTVTSTPVVRTQAHIRPQHGSGLPKQVLQVLPADAVRQLISVEIRRRP